MTHKNDGRDRTAWALFAEIEAKIFQLLRLGGGVLLAAVTTVIFRRKTWTAKLYLVVREGMADEPTRGWVPIRR